MDKWIHVLTENRSFCLGYFQRHREEPSPKLAMRVIRSDGRVLEECSESQSVSIGMVAGFPSPEQYEKAASDALDRAKEIRRRHEQTFLAKTRP